MAWNLSYVGKWEQKKKPQSLQMGSLVHDLLDDYYQGQIDGERDSLSRHRNKLTTLSQDLEDSEALQNLSFAGGLIHRYITEYALYEDAQYRPVASEQHYEVGMTTPEGRDYIFELYFDVLFEDRANGKLWMVDHKTHKSNKWTPTQIMMDPQLPSYAMALRELLDIPIFGMTYNMLNTYDYKKPPPVEKLFLRESTYRTPEELDNITLEIGHAVDDILENKDKVRRTLQRDCDRCRFQEPCLMGLKGMDMNLILEDNFKQKGGRPQVEESNLDIRIL